MKPTATCFICDGDGVIDDMNCPSCDGDGEWELDFEGQEIACSYCVEEPGAGANGFCQRGQEHGYMNCGITEKDSPNPPPSSGEKE